MRNLFEAEAVQEVKGRIARLRPDSERLWGKMTAAQAVAHCSGGLEFAVGDKTPPRMFLGRIMGGVIKPLVLGNDRPMRRNSPTVKGLIVADQRDLSAERERLYSLIDRFVLGGRGRLHHACAQFLRTPDAGRVGDLDV